MAAAAAPSPAPPVHRSKNDEVVPDFIQKLFNMLESTDETSCYHWGRQGTAFVIDDTNEFAKTVLPRRFKHSNFSSFVRQLNKYDFHKIRFADNNSSSSAGQQQAWEFQHPLFRRDKKHLLAQIHRKGNTSKNNNATKKNHRPSASGNVSPSSSTTSSSTAILDPSKSTTDTSAALLDVQHLNDLQASLQSQIDKLSSTQHTLASTLGRLVTTDTMLLNELRGLKRKMDEKDSILWTILNQSPKKQHTSSSSLDPMPLDHHQQKTSPPSPTNIKQESWPHPENTSTAPLFLPSSSSPLPHPPQTSSATTAPPSTVTTPMPIHELQHPPFPTASTSLPSSPNTTTTTATSQQQPSLIVSNPVVESQSSSSPATTAAAGASTTCHSWRHRPKILVVEDNVVYRRISMRCLDRLGCAYQMACDGLEAVACMKVSHYDLILMDISIPKLDGMAATRTLRQYDQHTPVVSMTASYSDIDIQNYVGSGMSDLLPKPFDQHKLYDIIKQHCSHLI
ncbi:HSF-type DNA-binding-domain-containing protein [Absidia repens]|uniref:Transcription factor n=1 Tax=Absidia repens TaxID=90262 RepID=A0A1X2IJ84_9FUNG|nr:HSF-type DNA-binding-domain-containing protein [Absidia repens]